MSKTRRPLPASYVVRVYRSDPSRLNAVAGLIEDVEAGQTTSFRNGTELLETLRGDSGAGSEQDANAQALDADQPALPSTDDNPPTKET